MAQYKHLPIYKATYDLLELITRVFAKPPGPCTASEQTSINLVERGFNALGSIIRPHARYVRRSTVRRGMAAIRTMCDEHADPLKIAQVANSYFAILRHANAYGQRAALAGLLRSRGHLVSPKLTRMFHGVPA